MENTMESTIDTRRVALQRHKDEIVGHSDNDQKQKIMEQIVESAGQVKISETIRNLDIDKKKDEIHINDVISVDTLVVRFLETNELEIAKSNLPGAAVLIIQKLYEYNAEPGYKNFADFKERRYLAPIVLKLLTKKDYLQLNKDDHTPLSDIENDYRILYIAKAEYAERMDYALVEAAKNNFLAPQTEADVRKRLAFIKISEVKKQAKDLLTTSLESRDAAMLAPDTKFSADKRDTINHLIINLLTTKDANFSNFIPPAVVTILQNLFEYDINGDQKNVARPNELIYLAPIVLKLVSQNDYLKMFKGDAPLQTDFEADYSILYSAHTRYADRMIFALKKAARTNPLNLSATEIDERIDHLQKTESDIKREKLARIEAEKAAAALRKSEGSNHDLDNIKSYFQEDLESQRLAEAIYSNKQEVFWDYVRGILNGNGEGGNPKENQLPQGMKVEAEGELKIIIKKRFIDKNLPPPDDERQKVMLQELTHQMASDEIMNRCRVLMGKLFMAIDKISPRDPSQEAMRRGDMIKNLGVITDNYLKRFDILQKYEVPNDIGLTFWRKKQDEFTRQVEVTTSNVDPSETTMKVVDGKVKTFKSYTFLHPGFRDEKLQTTSKFFQYVQNKVRSELEQRQINHDLRANPYNSASQTSFWRRMQQIMSKYTNTEIDNFADLYDSDTIFQAARTWDKINELNLARNNWTLTSLIDRPDTDTGWNKTDQTTHDYIMNLLAKRDNDGKIINEEELMRAINLGIAFNYGPSLRAFTVPACADAAVDVAGKPNLQSFGQGDSALLRVFNPQSFDQLRWDSQTAKEAGLAFTVFMGEDLKKIYQNWDYRTLQLEIEKHQKSFVIGANADDVRNKRVRYSDIINICRVGSLYESGWRKSFSYEGWLTKDVKESWIAMENIGIEAMRTYAADDIEKKVDSNFYKDGATNVEKRKEFIEFLYKRYFSAPEAGLTEEQIRQNIDNIFNKLEIEAPDLGQKIGDTWEKEEDGYAPKKNRSSNYKEFYTQVITRAIAQRMPTKFIRIESERRRKVPSERDTAMQTVFKLSKDHLSLDIKDKDTWDSLKAKGVDAYDETYHQALQDICAYGESLLRSKVAKKIKDELKYNDNALHEIQRDDFELTPERMEQMWNDKDNKIVFDSNPNIDAARKKNAIAVLRTNRAFIFNPGNLPGSKKSFLDEFAEKYHAGPPLGVPFVLGIEDLDTSLLAHSAQGEKSNSRVFGDIADSEEKTVDKLVDYYKVLRKVSKDKSHKYEPIVEAIKDMKSQISTMHGTEYANEFSRWMAIKAIAYFLINSECEGFMGWYKHKGESQSLAEQLGSALPGDVWKWNRLNVWEFCNALSLSETIPFNPFKTQKTPTMEAMFKLAADTEKFELEKDTDELIRRKRMVTKRDINGKKKQIEENWDRRKDDFENTATKLLEIFVKLPIRGEILKKLGGPLLIMIMIWLASSVFGGYNAATSTK